MRRPLFSAASAIVLLVSVGATSAQAAAERVLPMTEVAHDSAVPVFADGRWVSLPSTPTVPGGARDDLTGRVVAYPAAQCPPVFETGLGSAGGVAFVRCNGIQQAVFDLATQQLTPLPLRPGQTFIGSLGTQWALVAGDGADYHYLNWHTGEERPAQLTSSGVETLDPDTVDLRPLATLARSTRLLGRPDRRLVRFATPGVQSLSLRVGGRTVQLARRCPPLSGCRSVQYVSGVVTWAQGATVHTYVVRSRRHYTWTPTAEQQRLLAYMPGAGRVPTVTHTRNHVYAYWMRSRSSLAPGERKNYISFQGHIPAA